ncbi:MAG: Crp/Fnr family transcriptional regulator [Pseudomonadota bacterium]
MSDPLSPIFAGARETLLKKGETLFRSGDPVTRMYGVLSGRVDLARVTQNGGDLVFQVAESDAVIAEASAYSDVYHCDAVAIEPSKVRSVLLETFFARLERQPRLQGAWSRHLAQGLQSARFLAEIRTLHTVAARLDAWLAQGREIPVKGEWQNLASSLGVSREALYRELSKRRRRRGVGKPDRAQRKVHR